MKHAISVVVLAMLLASVSMVVADETGGTAGCSKLLVLGFQGNYPLQDFGIDASAGDPVAHNMLLVSCGHFTFDIWTSTQLSGGEYGSRGSGDEWEAEFAYNNSVDTPLGEFNYKVYAAYYALDLGKELDNATDDVVQTYTDVSRTFELGPLKAAPFARYIHLFRLGDGRDPVDFIRAGVRLGVPFSLPLIGDLQAQGELAHTSNLNRKGVVPHPKVWRGEAGLTRELGYGWSVTAGAKVTEFLGAIPVVKLSYSF